MKFLFLKTFIVSTTMCLMAGTAYALKTGSISGTILRKNTQQALAGANVNIAGTNLPVAADSNGRFRILNILVKTYNLVISPIEFKTFTRYNIVVNSGNENVFTIELKKEAAALGEVIIKANKRSVRAATSPSYKT